MTKELSLENNQYKEALLKYAYSYVRKKRKSKGEKELEDVKRYYVIYARKSTEDDKRQVQSIEDQIDQCKKFAKREGLEIVEILREEKSAKVAGKRDVFNSMLERLYKGDFYNGVLSWHPDRLSRNMKESGEILDMLDNDYIVDLKFPSYAFNNDAAGKMTLSILFAMAKEFSDKLSEDTKRGNKKKVKDGKYMGSSKRGYTNNKDDYFRKDQDTYDLYKKAWQKYLETNNQSEVAKWLNKQGEEISTNMMSEFFRDPFSAGIYCYGDQVVDLTAVDSRFIPMVSPKDFVNMQKMNRDNPRGWRITDEFRPFNDFVLCSDCNNPMTSGLSRSKSGTRMLYVTCGNRHCKDKRRKAGKKPISNSIRGETIVDFVKEAFEKLKEVKEDTYNKAKEQYFAGKNTVIADLKDEITILKGKKSKLESKEKKASDRLYEEDNEDMKKKISKDIQIFLSQIKSLEEQIGSLEQKKSELEYQMEADFPPYEDFLNFFENASTVIENTDNAYLVDQIVKLVFLNTEASDKKVSKYWLREPFDEYESLKILNGVDEGI